jgi:peptidyl-prolyl cis-trans isomerase C
MKLIFKTFFGFFLVLSLLFDGGCRDQPQGGAPILIRVDGRVIGLEQFQQEFARSLPAEPNLLPEEKFELQRAFLVQVIDRELTLAEADRLGLAVSPAEIEAALTDFRQDYDQDSFDRMLQERGLTPDGLRGELASNLLIERVVRRAAYAGIEIPAQAVNDYYQQHQEEFNRPEQVRARQIVVATEEEGDRLLGLLRQGESFAKLAGAYSLSPDGENGGDLGFFARGEMPPEFDDAVANLPVGRLSGLIKSPYGYHIFLVEERRRAKHLPLDEAAANITTVLRRQAEERAYQKWLQGLRARADIEININLLTVADH